MQSISPTTIKPLDTLMRFAGKLDNKDAFIQLTALCAAIAKYNDDRLQEWLQEKPALIAILQELETPNSPPTIQIQIQIQENNWPTFIINGKTLDTSTLVEKTDEATLSHTQQVLLTLSKNLDECTSVDDAEAAIDEALKNFFPLSQDLENPLNETQKEIRNRSIMHVVAKVNQAKMEFAFNAYGRVLSKNPSARPKEITENTQLNIALDHEGMLRFLQDIVAVKTANPNEQSTLQQRIEKHDFLQLGSRSTTKKLDDIQTLVRSLLSSPSGVEVTDEYIAETLSRSLSQDQSAPQDVPTNVTIPQITDLLSTGALSTERLARLVSTAEAARNNLMRKTLNAKRIDLLPAAATPTVAPIARHPAVALTDPVPPRVSRATLAGLDEEISRFVERGTDQLNSISSGLPAEDGKQVEEEVSGLPAEDGKQVEEEVKRFIG